MVHRLNMSKISCIITSFNNSPYLAKAVESVLAQTRIPDEIIIADDASTDGSRDMILSMAGNHHLIKPVLRESNLGVAANRDLAIRDCKSDYLTTLDGDDFFYPSKIEMEMSAIGDNDKTIAYSDYDMVDNDGTLKNSMHFDAFRRLNHRERLGHLLFREKPIPRDMLIPLQAYRAAGGFSHDLNIYEDWDLKLRLAGLDDKWKHSGITGVGYRKNTTGLSTTRKAERLPAFLNIFSRNSDWLIRELGKEVVGKAIIKIIGREIGYRKITLSRKKQFDALAFISNEKIT
jgi:glycosyltransferase involved in cell wall biosynthesis